MEDSEQKHKFDICRVVYKFITKKIFQDNTVLQDVCDAGARKLKAEVDPEGSNHNKCSGDSQHSPWRHLIYNCCYFKNLKQPENNTVVQAKFKKKLYKKFVC